MTKSIKYDCYAYLVVDRPTNTYPIRNPKDHLQSIFSLKVGDRMYIKGLGELTFDGKHVENYDYTDRGKEGLYQEIAIKCVTII